MSTTMLHKVFLLTLGVLAFVCPASAAQETWESWTAGTPSITAIEAQLGQVEARNDELPANAAPDSPEGALRVVDTHLHAAYTDTGLPDIYAGERMGQVVELAHGLARGSAPIVPLGDFNMIEGSDEYTAWMGLSGTSDVAAAFDARTSTIPNRDGAWDPFATGRRIDYAFVRDGRETHVRPLRIERIHDEQVMLGDHEGHVSDHAGLSLDVELVPRGGSPSPTTAHDLALRTEAVRLARTRLEEAPARTEARARRQTTLGLAGLVASGVTGFAGDLATRNRRGLLRALVFGLPALGLAASGVTVALGQAFTSSAAQQFAAAARLLDDFEAP